MPKDAKISVHPAFRIGTISPRIYGAFLEPIGTMVNGSMYNPRHPSADNRGFRQDFIRALQEAGLKAIRLPGGNFVSGWDWKDSIGPLSQRKAHLDPAWFQYIPNDVGHDEYLQWAESIGAEAMYTVNLGTGTIRDAMDAVEYTNHPDGTYWSDLRRRNGHPLPYGVKTWYLGNEMDGPWQIGSWEKDPRGYGVTAHEVSKAMKWTDPGIETAACASSSPFLAHYPQWDLEVLQECYETVDYLSLHHYHSAPAGDWAALLGGSCYFEDYINTEAALCDFVQTKMRSPRKMMLSFDEYGTMARPCAKPNPGYGPHNLAAAHYRFDPGRKYLRYDPDDMSNARQYPQQSDMFDALTAASTLLVFLRHADRVKIACMTRGINALAATDRLHVWKAGAHYPLTQLMRFGQGVSLRTAVEGPVFDLPGYAIDDNAQYQPREGLPYLDTAAALQEENGELCIFVINRHPRDEIRAAVDVGAFPGCRLEEHIQMYSPDPDAVSTWEHPDAVLPETNTETVMADGIVKAGFAPLSWNILRFSLPRIKG